MKKFLSLILTAILLLSFVPVVYAEENTYKVGDIIQFGSYPQSEVKDEALITELNKLAPEWDDWTSYGYYSGGGDYGTMVQGDWMRYTDVVYGDTKYRGVKFLFHRPYISLANFETDNEYGNNYQYDNGYYVNIIYWFKFETLDWIILDPFSGLVMCESIIDTQPYSNTIYRNKEIKDIFYAVFNDPQYSNYASDYDTSSIRKWLNNDFYDTAFSEKEKTEIKPTPLDNTSYMSSFGFKGYEMFDSNQTFDKIFLLSHSEVSDGNYGFDPDIKINQSSTINFDKERRAAPSDYAKCQGIEVSHGGEYSDGKSYWILRSAGDTALDCCFVTSNGDVRYFNVVDNVCSSGIRPAFRCGRISGLDQINHKHIYQSVVKTRTCTTQGYTTYTCSCGDTYISDYVNYIGHYDKDDDGRCDVCNESIKKLNFFQKIAEWFRILFDKLFGWLKF